MNPFELIILIFIFFFAVILHEFAHGWVASKFGDPTAKMLGRLTLNPLSHIDPVGTIFVPLILFLTGAPIFGWAKPVPVNFLNLHHPKRDMIWVGLAGPAMNALLAVTLSVILRLNPSTIYPELIRTAIVINLALAVFNLIPIPPLDGSRLVLGLLPSRFAYSYSLLEPYGIIIVLALLYLKILDRFIFPVIYILARYLGVQ